MFAMTTALLPSALAATFVMLTYAAWMEGRHKAAVLWSVACTLGIGWPFVAVLFVPMALDIFCVECTQSGLVEGCGRVLKWGVWALALVLPPTLAVDVYMYRRVTWPNFNIVAYNVLGGGGGLGDTLYGTEPASFYMNNMILNLNLVAPLALLTPLALLLTVAFGSTRDVPLTPGVPRGQQAVRQCVVLSAGGLWLCLMFSKAHKEERFLFPIYPLLCLGAAFTVEALPSLLTLASPSLGAARRVLRACLPVVFLVSVVLSCSRVLSMHRNFGAPLVAGHYLTAAAEQTVCIGQDWYRFPPQFFLPPSAHLAFVKSPFGGQLPQPFAPEGAWEGTWQTPSQPFNDLNQEEPSRYVRLVDCKFLVEHFPGVEPGDADAIRAAEEALFQEAGGLQEWDKVLELDLLDANKSPSPYRAYYIPWLTPSKVRFSAFNVYRRKS
jgi:alpha-1,2-mannosyltransferase